MAGLFAIHDTMRFIAPDVSTICVGQAASAAAVLLAAGAKGKRYALPNARVLVHQPHGGAQGQSVDMEIAVAEMVEMRRLMVDILIEATGQPHERITSDMDRDFILRGQKAIDYGLVDHIIDRRALADPMIAASVGAGSAGAGSAGAGSAGAASQTVAA
jgi:ATP-dependent Clp protease protease subunit